MAWEYLPSCFRRTECHHGAGWCQLPSESRSKAPTTFDGRLLDQVNVRLLEELHADPRLSMSELGRRVGMSAPAGTAPGPAPPRLRGVTRGPRGGQPAAPR